MEDCTELTAATEAMLKEIAAGLIAKKVPKEDITRIVMCSIEEPIAQKVLKYMKSYPDATLPEIDKALAAAMDEFLAE